MASIDAERKICTLINVFTVEPDRQQALVDLLAEATEKTMRHQPGYLSANIHRGLDGRHVTNYAQWESREAFEAMLRNPEAQEHMGKAAQLAVGFEPQVYEVVYTHER